MMRRLTFAVRDGAIELVSDQRIEMKASPAPRSPAARAGFWCEVRDRTERVLVAAPAPDPLHQDREAFSPDPVKSVQRVPGASPPTAFSILVPDVDGAESVSLMRVVPSVGPHAHETVEGVASAAVEIARFKLGKEQN